jgi:dolichyl-phosphate-mannose-protein mannosyltransferase
MSDASLSGRGGRLSALAIAFVLAGVALRLAYVGRPFDHRLRAPWRQADYVQMARNFAREDPNLLHPRIDWRGDTPGLVESEFPLVPWTAGMLYRVIGEEPRIMRVVSALLSIGSLLLAASLARRLLPPPGAAFAIATFALNPLLFHLATAMQPEPLMLFLSILAVDLLERWSASLRPATLVLAGTALGGAILAKAPAACLGILFACVILSRFKTSAFARLEVWAGALAALVPAALWYGYAKRFYTLYGNSLGLSSIRFSVSTCCGRRPS